MNKGYQNFKKRAGQLAIALTLAGTIAIGVNAATVTGVTKANVNMRSGAGTKYKVVKVVKANKVNYMAIPPLELGEELSCTAKIRYGHKGSPCVIKRPGEDEITCTFPDGVRAPTPGQAVVFYVDGCVGGGGTITEAER